MVDKIKSKKRVSLHVYIDVEVDQAIKDMCNHHGDYAHIVREVLKAFVNTKVSSTDKKLAEALTADPINPQA